MERRKTQMLAEVETGLAKRFRKKLIDDGLTYRRWLESQIADYVTRPREQPKLVRREAPTA